MESSDYTTTSGMSSLAGDQGLDEVEANVKTDLADIKNEEEETDENEGPDHDASVENFIVEPFDPSEPSTENYAEPSEIGHGTEYKNVKSIQRNPEIVGELSSVTLPHIEIDIKKSKDLINVTMSQVSKPDSPNEGLDIPLDEHDSINTPDYEIDLNDEIGYTETDQEHAWDVNRELKYFGSETSMFKLAEPEPTIDIKEESLEHVDSDDVTSELEEAELSETNSNELASVNVHGAEPINSEVGVHPVALRKASDIHQISPKNVTPKGKVTMLLGASSIGELKKLWDKPNSPNKKKHNKVNNETLKDTNTEEVIVKSVETNTVVSVGEKSINTNRLIDSSIEKSKDTNPLFTSTEKSKPPKETNKVVPEKPMLTKKSIETSTTTIGVLKALWGKIDSSSKSKTKAVGLKPKTSLKLSNTILSPKKTNVKPKNTSDEIPENSTEIQGTPSKPKKTKSIVNKPNPAKKLKKKCSTLETCLANKVTKFKLKNCTKPCKVKLHKVETIYQSYGNLQIDLRPLKIREKAGKKAKKNMKRTKPKGNKVAKPRPVYKDDLEDSELDDAAAAEDSGEDFEPDDSDNDEEYLPSKDSRKSSNVQLSVNMQEVDLNEDILYDYFSPVKPKVKKRKGSKIGRRRTSDEECKCKSCDYVARGKNDLQRHASKYHPMLPCEFCEKKFRLHDGLLEHMAMKHTGIKYLKCPHEGCDFATKTREDLKRHQKVHCSDKPHICSLCGWATKWPKNLRSHHLMMHTDERPFKCDKCPYTCKRDTDLKQHMFRHTTEKPIECLVCGFRVKTNWELRSHALTHSNEKPFKCTFPGCEAATKTNADLTKHMRKHKSIRDFICSTCHKGFKTQSDLNKHINTVHTDTKRFACDICGKLMKSKHNVRKHLFLHTGKKPFQCQVCGNRFSNKSNMKVHMLTHDTTNRPYICPLCPHASKQADHLLTHIGSAHGDKYAYFCELCLKPFQRYLGLRLHYERMHTKAECDKINNANQVDLALLQMEMKLSEETAELEERRARKSRSQEPDIEIKEEVIDLEYGDVVTKETNVRETVNDVGMSESKGEVIKYGCLQRTREFALTGDIDHNQPEENNVEGLNNEEGVGECEDQELGNGRVTESGDNADNVCMDFDGEIDLKPESEVVDMYREYSETQARLGNNHNFVQPENIDYLLNAKKVAILGVYGDLRLPLATKGFNFNYRKNGTKPNTWFMDVGMMQGNDAEKQKLYLRRQGILPPIPRGRPPRGKRLSTFLKERRRKFMKQKKRKFAIDIGLAMKKNTTRNVRFKGKYSDFLDSVDDNEEEEEMVSPRKKIKTDPMFETLEGEMLTVTDVKHRLPSPQKPGTTGSKKVKAVLGKKQNMPVKAKKQTIAINNKKNSVKSKKKQLSKKGASQGIGPKLSTEKRKKAVPKSQKKKVVIRKPSFINPPEVGVKMEVSSPTLERNSFEALESIISEVNSSQETGNKVPKTSPKTNGNKGKRSKGNSEKGPKYKYVPVKLPKKRKINIAKDSGEIPVYEMVNSMVNSVPIQPAKKRGRPSKESTPKKKLGRPKKHIDEPVSPHQLLNLRVSVESLGIVETVRRNGKINVTGQCEHSPKKRGRPKKIEKSPNKTGRPKKSASGINKKPTAKAKKLKVKFDKKQINSLQGHCDNLQNIQSDIAVNGDDGLVIPNIHVAIQNSQLVMVYPPGNDGTNNLVPVYASETDNPEHLVPVILHEAQVHEPENNSLSHIPETGNVVAERLECLLECDGSLVKVRENSVESDNPSYCGNIYKVRQNSEENDFGGSVFKVKQSSEETKFDYGIVGQNSEDCGPDKVVADGTLDDSGISEDGVAQEHAGRLTVKTEPTACET